MEFKQPTNKRKPFYLHIVDGLIIGVPLFCLLQLINWIDTLFRAVH